MWRDSAAEPAGGAACTRAPGRGCRRAAGWSRCAPRSAGPTCARTPSWPCPRSSPTRSCTARRPVTVRLRGTRDHPRVEVRDASADPPALTRSTTRPGVPRRPPDVRPRARRSWPASARPGAPSATATGKLVWFVPSPQPPAAPGAGRRARLGRRARGAVVRRRGDDDRPPAATCPSTCMQGTLAHGAELRRELRLLAVAHQDTYPVASDLSAYFSCAGPRLPAAVRRRGPARGAADRRSPTRPRGAPRRSTPPTGSPGCSSSTTSPTRSAATSGCSRSPGRPSRSRSRPGCSGSSCARAPARTRRPGRRRPAELSRAHP